MTRREETKAVPAGHCWRGGEQLKQDAERPGGGGPKFHPYDFTQAQDLLKPQAATLATAVRDLPDYLVARHVVFEATLHPNYLASSHFPAGLLEQQDLYAVGTRQSRAVHRTKKRETPDQPTKSIILAGPKEKVESFAELLMAPTSGRETKWQELRKFGHIELPNPKRVVKRTSRALGAGEVITWEAVLNPIGRTPAEFRAWTDEAFQKWVAWVQRLGGDVDVSFRRSVGGLTFVPIAINNEEIENVARFNLLRAIRPMPQIRPLPGPLTRATSTGQLPPSLGSEVAPATDLAVAIFDGGIDANVPHLRQFTDVHHLTPEAEDGEATTHGSLVTSAFLYGSVSPSSSLPRPVAKVDHFRILPVPQTELFDHNAYWVLDRIVETVEGGDYKLVSLSIGPDQSLEDDAEPARWTAELDRLAYERETLFTCAVGNNGLCDHDLGLDRIQVPADMVNGIGVGACQLTKHDGPPTRASFSAIGPGREGQRIQPTGVMFGGDEENPFLGIGPGGTLFTTAGTSFSAPNAMHGFANLAGSLGNGRLSPEHLRAFGIHFARRRKREHRPNEIGHGRFLEHYGDVWSCSENECVVLYEEALERNGTVAFPFPLPSGLADDCKIDLEWTITFLSEVDPKDTSDYTSCGVELTFRPHERLRTLTDTKAKRSLGKFHLDHDREQIVALMSGGSVELSGHPPADSRWRPYKTEQGQRSAGKWETVVRGRVRRTAGDLFRPRVDMAYLRRANGSLVKGDVRPLHVAMLVTMRAPVEVPLYDMVRARFPMLSPLVSVPVPLSVPST